MSDPVDAAWEALVTDLHLDDSDYDETVDRHRPLILAALTNQEAEQERPLDVEPADGDLVEPPDSAIWEHLPATSWEPSPLDALVVIEFYDAARALVERESNEVTHMRFDIASALLGTALEPHRAALAKPLIHDEPVKS